MIRGPYALFLAAAFLLGTTAGVILKATLLAPDAEPPAPPKALSPAEITAMCADVGASDVARLEAAQAEVVTLQQALTAKEAELAEAEAEAATSKEAGDAARARVKTLQREVAELKSKVVGVVEERDRIAGELRTTLAALDEQTQEAEVQRAEAGRWRTSATGAAWRGLVSEAKAQICDRGTAKRHDRCHAAVDAALADGDLRLRFEACVDSGQATPSLGQVDPKGAPPEFAVRLIDDKQFGSRGWYVLLCDPTLPEAVRPVQALPTDAAGPAIDPELKAER